MRDYKVSIVIPTYNTWKLTQGLLDGLSRHESERIDHVTIVNDCSTDTGGIETDLPFYILNLPKNSGFPIACNEGLKINCSQIAEKRIVFLISNDVIVNGKFIEQAADILFDARRYLVGNRYITFDTGWNTFEGKTFPYLEGWFYGATSDGWKDIGFFDENYYRFDYEDIDLSTTAKTKGYKLVSLNNPNLIHMGGQTIGFNPEREAVTRKNQEYFKKKWLS